VQISTEDIAKQMLVLLPDDGTPVLNRVMRVMLARALSADIDEERYRKARQQLQDRGQVGLIRAREPQRFETWEILVEPARKPTPAAEIDVFLDERLHDAQRKQIRSLLNGAPA
jgi:hypothetical protein